MKCKMKVMSDKGNMEHVKECEALYIAFIKILCNIQEKNNPKKGHNNKIANVAGSV